MSTAEGGTSGSGGQQANGLWYDSGSGTNNADGSGNAGTVTAATFQNNWVAMATRYANNPTVIGFDLQNQLLASAPAPTPTPTPTPTSGLTQTPAAFKNSMLAWLRSFQGKGTIVVQHLLGQSSWDSANNDGVTQVYNETGKWVAGLGGQYYNDDNAAGAAPGTFGAINWAAPNSILKQWWAAGGIVLLSGFPFPSPAGSGYGPVNASYGSPVNGADLITPGTQTYNNWHQTLDDVAAGIQDLVNAGVVILFRPLHEQSGNWFWWGTDIIDTQFITLWQQMYDYYTKTYNFGNNLIWVYGACANGNDMGRYPGNAYVDIVGFYDYSDTPPLMPFGTAT